MEASKFGFGADMAPAYKFDPTDEDIVAYYLLPRALDRTGPYAHAIIDDDPASLLPWDLLLKHGHGDSDHAFFFGPPGRRSRVLNGGTWQGQQGVVSDLTLVQEHPGRAELDITYKKYNLAFCTRGKRGDTAGFVMHEFQILSPPLANTMLTRIRVTDKGKQHMAALRRQLAEVEALHAAGNQQLAFPVAEQPAESDTVASEMVLYDPDQPGPSCQYYPAVTVDDDEETHALYEGNDGDMVASAAAGYYIQGAECGGDDGEYTNYCQYQSVDHLDPSYQYDAGSSTMTCDGEGFSGGQTGNGGGMEEATATASWYEYDYASWEGGTENNQYCNEFIADDGVNNQDIDYGQGSGQ